MPFRGVRIEVEGRSADRWSEALLVAGALSVDIGDPAVDTDSETARYDEPASGDAGELPGAGWATVRISALFAAEVDPGPRLSGAAAMLGEGVPAGEIYAVADDDWVQRSQSQFGPIRIRDRLVIAPSWCVPEDGVTSRLVLDPGLAFGTGTHPTTRLCLEWLADHLAGGEAVLDYGCGSGILALAAARLGASRAVGTDIDPQAIRVSTRNAQVNGVAAVFVAPEALSPDERFDVVVSNILANPLLHLAPLLAAHTRSGGRIVLSGILDRQAAELASGYSRWFKIDVAAADDGWALLVGVRRAEA